jgi:hypothetical protein
MEILCTQIRRTRQEKSVPKGLSKAMGREAPEMDAMTSPTELMGVREAIPAAQRFELETDVCVADVYWRDERALALACGLLQSTDIPLTSTAVCARKRRGWSKQSSQRSLPEAQNLCSTSAAAIGAYDPTR